MPSPKYNLRLSPDRDAVLIAHLSRFKNVSEEMRRLMLAGLAADSRPAIQIPKVTVNPAGTNLSTVPVVDFPTLIATRDSSVSSRQLEDNILGTDW